MRKNRCRLKTILLSNWVAITIFFFIIVNYFSLIQLLGFFFFKVWAISDVMCNQREIQKQQGVASPHGVKENREFTSEPSVVTGMLVLTWAMCAGHVNLHN